jgi:ergothioneine biosynthesis protein EgtB
MKELFEELKQYQEEAIRIVNSVSQKDYFQQFHPDLSPIGWHLGHCAYIESYWIREQLLGKQAIEETLKLLYVPELSHKQSRGSALPDKNKMLEWVKVTHADNRELLKSAIINNVEHHLLENNYLLYFLNQHYSQHIETMHLALTEMQLQYSNSQFTNTKKLNPIKPMPKSKIIETDIYGIGINQKERAYDNEQPAHSQQLNQFKISTYPVSNSEYLQFINEDGYSEKQHWSDEGWQWISQSKHQHPHHWRLQKNEDYYGVNHNGPYTLEEDHPVHGLSYYEAQAYANWVGARLPHEYEWEVATIKNSLEQSKLVWEWCANTFHPYKDFSAYPYEGYSAPYFDGKHYVLRGGSIYTKEQIKRPSFRNYYTADKRHMVAGLRLVYD